MWLEDLEMANDWVWLSCLGKRDKQCKAVKKKKIAFVWGSRCSRDKTGPSSIRGSAVWFLPLQSVCQRVLRQDTEPQIVFCCNCIAAMLPTLYDTWHTQTKTTTMEDITSILFFILGRWLFAAARRTIFHEKKLKAARQQTAEPKRRVGETLLECSDDESPAQRQLNRAH